MMSVYNNTPILHVPDPMNSIEPKYLGRRIVVTGAGADPHSDEVGFGFQTAEDLFSEGASVIILGRKKDRLEEAARRICSSHSSSKGNVDQFACDVTNEGNVAEVFAEIKRVRGNVYGLVNNAACNVRKPLAEVDIADVRHVIETNLVGPMIVSKYAVGHMLEKGEGSIVNVSSIAAKQPTLKNMPAYDASKWGLEGLTASIARDYGNHGIRCNNVRPGYARTPLTSAFFDQNPDKLREILAQQLGGLVSPREVSKAILHYLDPKSTKSGWTLEISKNYSPIED